MTTASQTKHLLLSVMVTLLKDINPLSAALYDMPKAII